MGYATTKSPLGSKDHRPAIIMQFTVPPSLDDVIDLARAHLENLKKRMIAGFREKIEDVRFNGDCENLERSNYTVLNVSLPPSDINDMLLFNLDIAKISASGGSACSSGSEIGSHVLGALGVSPDRGNVRFSFGKYNTEADIDYAVNTVAEMYKTITI